MRKQSKFSDHCYFISGICFSLLALIFQSCSIFDYGTIEHSLKFTTETSEISANSPSFIKSDSNDRYTQFGAYITSITPGVFTASIRMMGYQDNWDITDKSTHLISYVNDSVLNVDFSNNQEVSITPTLYSTDLHGDRIFRQKEVTFIYFTFVPDYLYQEFELPSEYTNIHLNQIDYISSARFGNIIKINNNNLLTGIISTGFTFVFGNTDSTFIFNKEHLTIKPSENNPFGDDGSGFSGEIIRSCNYTPITVTMPESGETITMYSTVSFDTQNLIQVYAGADNVPYTSDDVFVYAPGYWDRIKVKLEIK